MKVKTIPYSQTFNPFYLQFPNIKSEFHEMIPQINQSNINEYSSPIISYFNSSNEYLIKKYSEAHNTIDLEKSNNFIRKDSYYLNEQNNSNSSNESSKDNIIDNNQINQSLNEIYFHKNQIQIKNTLNNNFQNSNINYENKIQNSKNGNRENTMIMINNNIPIFSQNININKNIEMFGKKGWICPFCNNFNYENRTKCNRCKIVKYNKNHNKKRNIEKETINNQKKNNLLKQKQFSERLGDWICFKCQNLNFAFRIFCNRCQLSKEESYNYFNGFNEKNKNIENMINNNNTTNLFINQKAIVVDVINKENNNNI